MRIPHWLTDVKKGELPSRLVFFDCETKPVDVEGEENTIEQKFWFAHAAYIRRKRENVWTKPEYRIFESSTDMWDWMLSKSHKKTKLYIFAHNVGFDASVSYGFKYLTDNGFKPRMPILDDPPTIITYKRGLQTVVIIDTLNYFRVSLEVLGKSVGLEKLSFPGYDKRRKIWDEYCHIDVEITLKAMLYFISFIHDNELGNFKPTLPSQSMAAFKHRFKPATGIFIDDNVKALELARQSYHGGRVEVFQLGKLPNKVTCLDFNSMYPYVMRDKDYPYRLVAHAKSINLIELQKIIIKYCVTARVKLQTNTPIYSYQLNGKLVFPVGTFEATLTTPEIKTAFDRGHIQEVLEVSIYEKGKIFSDYVNFFYNERLAMKARGDEAGATMCKLFLNSHYGKYGQSGRVFKDVGTAPPEEMGIVKEWDVDTQQFKTYRTFQGIVQLQETEGESKDSFPAIAAHVTAYGRLMLWEHIEIAGLENVFYSDTDSVFVNDQGVKRLESFCDNDRLGALKPEWNSTDVLIRGNKDYRIDGKDKIKGVRKTATIIFATAEIEGSETFIPLESINFNTYIQERFESIKGKIRSGDMNRQRITIVSKTYSRNYLKGDVGEDGRITPYVLVDGVIQDAKQSKDSRAREKIRTA